MSQKQQVTVHESYVFDLSPRNNEYTSMNSDDCVVLVVDSVDSERENLRELIEFMDTTNVRTATPANWKETLGDHRLEAIFIGPDLSELQIDSLLNGVEKLDPNVPIVMLNGGQSQ